VRGALNVSELGIQPKEQCQQKRHRKNCNEQHRHADDVYQKEPAEEGRYQGNTAVASISTRAPSSSNAATCTSVIAGYTDPTISR
jgi:hypothetical protein